MVVDEVAVVVVVVLEEAMQRAAPSVWLNDVSFAPHCLQLVVRCTSASWY